MKTVKAIIDEHGNVTVLEHVRLPGAGGRSGRRSARGLRFIHGCRAICLLPLVLATASPIYAQASQPARSQDTATSSTTRRPYLRIGANVVNLTWVSRIPDGVRRVSPYTRPGSLVTLDGEASGEVGRFPFGVGFPLTRRFELLVDATYRNSYEKGGNLWSALHFIESDDYVGYRIHGWDLDATMLFAFVKPQVPPSRNCWVDGGSQCISWHVRAGSRFHRNVLEAGTDAYNEFNVQRTAELHSVDFLLAVGMRIAGLEVEGEFSPSVHGNGGRTKQVNAVVRLNLGRLQR